MLEEKSVFHRVDSATGRSDLENGPELWAISYHSRPTEALTESDLDQLLLQAQLNNRRDEISGLLVVGDNDFVQWLEGAKPAVQNLMARISSDRRHADVTLLEAGPIKRRLFGDWSMLFVDEMRHADVQLSPMLARPSNLIWDLKHGGDVDAVFSNLADSSYDADAVIEPVLGEVDENKIARDLERGDAINRLVRAHIVPTLCNKVIRSNRVDAPLLATALAKAALRRDAQTTRSILSRDVPDGVGTLAGQVSLIEKTERLLGNMWQVDECTETDILLALVELIRGLRALPTRGHAMDAAPAPTPSVLVISQPGELHLLPALLDAEVLTQHGWTTTLEFPQDDDALNGLVEQSWFDAVDISLSDVFRRKGDLQHLAETVAAIRAHSRNRKIAITVGGRAFRGDVGKLMDTGADRLVLTANDVEWAISDALRARRY
ncbi:MAG: BLUF domain-containing protein [Pseudomonadota bacterium]